jgi:hypothetical protein
MKSDIYKYMKLNKLSRHVETEIAYKEVSFIIEQASSIPKIRVNVYLEGLSVHEITELH